VSLGLLRRYRDDAVDRADCLQDAPQLRLHTAAPVSCSHGVQLLRTLTTWHYPHSHAALLSAVQQSIDVSPVGRAAAVNCTANLLLWPTLAQTDGQTPDRCQMYCIEKKVSSGWYETGKLF